MKKIVLIFFLIMTFMGCTSLLQMSEREKGIIVAYDEITIRLDHDKKEGQIELFNLMFNNSLTEDHMRGNFEHLLNLADENRISKEIFNIKSFKSIEEILFPWDGRSSLSIWFEFTEDPKIILKEIFENIVYVKNLCDYDETSPNYLSIYFYYDKSMIFADDNSEHIELFIKDNSAYSKDYFITWDTDRGPFLTQFRDLFYPKFFTYIDDIVDINAYLEEQ